MRSILLCLVVALVLAACGGGGPKKRVFPPQAQIQQLQLEPDGWRLQLRVHNYSTVPMRFSRIEATLMLDSADAGTLTIDTEIAVVASSVELVETTLAPPPAVRDSVERALAEGRGIGYRLEGRIVSAEPRGTYPFEFASRLDRVPGLERVLR